MKKMLLITGLLFSIHSHANFETGLIMGLIFGSGNENSTTVIKDEFTTQVEVIERGIPTTFDKLNPTLSYSAYIDAESSSKYTSYFKNKGYNVYYHNGKLSFNLTKQYDNYLKTQKLYTNFFIFIGYLLGVLLIAFMCRFILERLYISYRIYGTDEVSKMTQLILMMLGKIKRLDTANPDSNPEHKDSKQ